MFQASTSSPFSQTPFGKPASTGFSAPVFGSTTNTNLFGGATTQQSGLFGASSTTPSFGQTQTTQPAFGGFTSASSGTGLFGSQPNASSGLFGSNTTSAFGQPKPAFGGFGTQQQAGGLFGQQPQQTQPQQPSLFGQPATQSASGLFGSTPGFGTTGTAIEGTTTKFIPVTGTDTMMKNGVSSSINTRHHCITCMKEYEGKSLEELRLEDYAANRKGPQQGVQGAGLFGATNQPSLFSASPSTGTPSTNLFGTENKSLFGATTQGFGTGSSNVFGAGTSGNTLFGKPAGTVTAFQTPASTTANTFGFNTNTSTNPFGAAQKPFGATTSQPGLFGNTSQPSTVFGTQTSGFGSFTSQPAQNGGLFGQNKQPFNMGTSGSFAFNQPTSTSSTNSLFGGKTTTGFSTFGTQANTTSAFGTTGFGLSNQNTTAFGTNFKGPTTSFNFGSTPANNSLGLNLGGGSSLFGNTSKPGGLFNQPSTGLFSGGFGTSNSSFSTGSNTLGGLGSQPFNLGGGLNANQNTNLGNQSGQFNQAYNHHLLACASTPFGDSPLFKNLLAPTGKADELIKPTSPATQKAMMSGQNYKVSPKNSTKIKVKPIESNSVTKKSLFEGLDGEEESNNDVLGQVVRPSPKRLILKPRSFSDVQLTQRSTLPGNSNLINEMSPVIKTSPKIMLRSSLTNRDNTTERCPSENIIKTPLSSQATKKNEVSPNLTDLGSQMGSSSLQEHDNTGRSENKEVLSTSSSSDSDMEDTVAPVMDGPVSEHPTGIVLRRLGYYTIPSLDELTELMDNEGRCVVDNFTVGRLNYGNIFYPDSFDVAGLNLDAIVHFRHKEVAVYPDDERKPPVGKDLNRRAQVTLDRVWPVDKTTRMPINDPTRISLLNYENKLRRANAKHGTKFLEYRPQTGSWVFKVDHFSKYGLSDSDEDEPPPQPVEVQKMKGVADQLKQAGIIHQLQPPAPTPMQFPSKQMNLDITSAAMLLSEDDEDMDDGINNPYDLDDDLERRAFSTTSKLAKELGTSSHKVQLMKASFFDRGFPTDGEFLEYDDIDQPANFQVNGFSFNAKKLAQAYKWYKKNEYSLLDPDNVDDLDSQPDLDLPEASEEEAEKESEEDDDDDSDDSFDEPLSKEISQPTEAINLKSYLLSKRDAVLSLRETTQGRHQARCLMDMDIFRDRSFHPSWGPLSQMLVMSTMDSDSNDLFVTIEGRKDNSPFVLERHNLYKAGVKSSSISFKESIEKHLEVTFQQSVLNDGDGNPFFTVRQGTESLQKHYNVSQMLNDKLFQHSLVADKYLKLSYHVWGLCFALWGDLECSPESHDCIMQRKFAVSTWLKNVLSDYVEEDLKKSEGSSAVFTFLTGHKIEEACLEAQKIGDIQLSLMLSQCQSPEIRSLIERQLIQWRETKADIHIDLNRIKCLMLVAGMPIHSTSNFTVNTCHELNWLQAFAIHLWYITSYSSSITDALFAYEAAFQSKEENYACHPIPFYCDEYIVEASQEKNVYNILYHILKLFSLKSHQLEQLLNPATYSPDPLDYRLGWILMRTFMELGYSHLSTYSANLIHLSFASQLEAHGLWYWAVFPLQHLPDPEQRERLIKDLIGKYITLNEECDREVFLQEKLAVPSEWIYEAKATLAVREKRYHEAAKYFIKAAKWNQSHEIIINHISSKALILKNYEYLEDLLKELGNEERQKVISQWNIAGGVILKYLELHRAMVELISNKIDPPSDYTVEKLVQNVVEFSVMVKQMKITSPLDSLSVVEMARMTADNIKALITLPNNMNNQAKSHLNECINSLPLPLNYHDNNWQTEVEYWNGS